MLNKLSTLRAQGVSEEGFTLIELIIVVVIIGILAAIAIPIFMNQQKSALAAGVKSDVRNTNTNVATALAKSPTAAFIGSSATVTAAPTAEAAAPASVPATGVFTKTVADIPVGADATATNVAKAVVSDANTFLTVTGDWDDYVITGQNVGLTGSYSFTSTTGVSLGFGELA